MKNLSVVMVTAMLAVGTSVSTQSQATDQVQATAQARLQKATALLDRLPDTTTPLTTQEKDKNEKAAKEIATLRRQFTELVNGYQSVGGQAGAQVDWKSQFSEVERTLARLIGGGSQLPSATVGAAMVAAGTAAQGARDVAAGGGTPGTPATRASAAAIVAPVQTAGVIATDAGNIAANANGPVATAGAATPGAVGTVGVSPAAASLNGAAVPQAVSDESLLAVAAAKVSMIGLKDLDPAIRKQLEDFRVELELFFTAPVAERGPGV